MQQENGRCDVRAVRVAQRQGLSDAIGAARLTDEIGELTRPAAHIILVEQTLAKASEEARHIAFEHVAARREERRPRRNRATKRDKIGFVAARSMKQEKRRTRSSCPRSSKAAARRSKPRCRSARLRR